MGGAAPRVEHFLHAKPVTVEQGAVRWELVIPPSPEPGRYDAYVLAIVGPPGRLVGVDGPLDAQAPLGSLYLGTERSAVFKLTLRQSEQGLIYLLESEVHSGGASAEAMLGLEWYCPESVSEPLAQVRWVGPAGEFSVPASGMDLLDLGQGSRLRITPAEVAAQFREPGH